MSSIMRARNRLMGRGEVSEVIGALSRAEGCCTFNARDRMPRPSRTTAHYLAENAPTATRGPSRASGFVLRRYLVVAARSGEGPLTDRLRTHSSRIANRYFVEFTAYAGKPDHGFRSAKPILRGDYRMNSRRRPAGAHRLLDQRGERQVQVGIRRQHVAAGHHVMTAGHVADVSARLADEEEPGGDVPRRQRELPKSLVPSGRDISEVERGRTHTPDAARRAHDRRERGHVSLLVGTVAKRHAGGDDRLAELAAGGDPQPAIVDVGARPLLRPIHLVMNGLVDHASDD